MNDSIWLALLSIAFAAWAGVVAWGVKTLTNQLDSLGKHAERLSGAFHDYTKSMEGRVSSIEEWKAIEQRKK